MVENATFITRQLYYQLKPWLPRSLATELRKGVTAWKLRRHRDTWPIDDRTAGPPEGWNGWPHGKSFALVLTHDVESEKGRDRCLDLARLEEEFGFRSSFNFVPRRYETSDKIRRRLRDRGFEVGVHGLYHDGLLYKSRKVFFGRALQINDYLRSWEASGFRSPAMHHNLNWILDLEIEYDSSTFDTDPFEPQPDGVGTVFPFFVGIPGQYGYVELPYTLPQDFTLFVLMGRTDISIWKRKLDWLASVGGMALVITHPDYMSFGGKPSAREEYPISLYLDLLGYVKHAYPESYWHATPLEVARFSRKSTVRTSREHNFDYYARNSLEKKSLPLEAGV